MKKIVSITIIIFWAAIVGMLLINNVQNQEKDVTKEKTKVGLILNGVATDRSWGQSHVEGLERTAKKLNLEIIYRECVPENEECIEYMQELIDESCKIIVCNSFGFGDYEYQMAQNHPEVYFFHASGILSSKNFTSYFGRIYQMRYLSGIVAGLQTQTNEIGYMAAMNISEVNRGINAFTLGVRSVNPDATVYVAWSNSWTDDALTEQATLRLIDGHDIDVITYHQNRPYVVEIAEKAGIKSIGYHVAVDGLSSNYLTSVVCDWEQTYEAIVREFLQGKANTKDNYWIGMQEGVVGLSDFSEVVSEKEKEKIQKVQERIANGWNVFSGIIKDQSGKLRCSEDEILSDEQLLEHFDWLAEGVEIYE